MSYSLTNLKFQKMDQYQNPIFIAGSEKNTENYTILREISEKLKEKEYNTFLPVYHSEEYDYASLRIRKHYKNPTFTANSTYNITFELRTVTKDDKTYVNIHLTKARMHTKAVGASKGALLEL
jgi:hypothetical protein